jgi:hypothetical protein
MNPSEGPERLVKNRARINRETVMAKWNDAFRKSLPGLIILGVIVMKIGPANIARRFDSYWNAAEIAKQKDIEMWNSAREAHEAMVRAATEPGYPIFKK